MTSLAESEWARRARHFCALERRLFEILGGWVPTVAEPEAKLLLRVHSFQHAWHAQLWAGLLPVGEDEGSAPLRPALAAALDVMAAPSGTGERLAGAYRALLPRLIGTYAGMGEELREATEGPVRRVLTLVRADDDEACRAGEAVLSGLVDEPAGTTAGGHADAVDAKIVAAGGLGITEMH